jgi:hypothetical protein
MSKAITLTGVSILVVALVLGMAVPALAAPNSAPPMVGNSENELLRGEVISIGDQEFTIQSDEEELTISVDEDTRYYLAVPGQAALVRQRFELHQQSQLELRAQGGNGRGLQNWVQATLEIRNRVRLQDRLTQMKRMPRLGLCCLRGLYSFGEQAEFADIAVGDGVVVLAEDNLARVVMIIKPIAYAAVSGTVSDIDSSFITIDSDDGPRLTLLYDEDTVFVPSVDKVEDGKYVRVIYDSLDGKALRVVVCPRAS